MNITAKNIKRDLFEADKYQINVSASSVVHAEKNVFVTMPSGQGKTIMMLLNALYEIGKNGHKSVGFVTSDNVLRE